MNRTSSPRPASEPLEPSGAARLRVLNELLEQAGRMAGLGVWEVTIGRGITMWSETCNTLLGLEADAPIAARLIETHVAPPWRASLRAQFLAGLRTRQAWSLPLQIVRADGQLAWVLMAGEPVQEGERICCVRGIMQDIDEAHRREEQLRESERHLSHIFRMVPLPMGISRRSDNKYLLVNPAWEAMTGIHQAQTSGLSAIEMGLYDPEDRARMIAAIDAQGQLDNHEINLYIRGGEKRTVVQSIRELDYHGEPCWLFSAHDITERIRSEERIREREELLSLTVAAAALGLWDWDLDSGRITGDERWRAMHGLAPTPQALPWPAASSGLSPQDEQAIAQALQAHIAHPATPFDQVWRVVLQEGGVRWVRNLGKLVRQGGQAPGRHMLGVSLDVTQQFEQQERLHHLAHYDVLTQLPNRLKLAQQLQEEMLRARRGGTQLGVVYLDLDRFKPVNDTLGHDVGDELLVKVARRLREALRADDHTARLGGDEFIILLPGLKSSEDCERKLHQLMRQLCLPYLLGTHQVNITASLGYTLYPQDTPDADADTLLRHADQAMYQAKQAGRNRCRGFDAGHARDQQARQERLQQLERALKDNEFTLYLQPKVDVNRRQVVGAECLIRWRHPQEGVLAPAAFLPALTASALEIEFDRWVFEEALRCIARLQAAGLPLPLGVNISAQYLQHGDFAPWVLGCLARHPQVDARLVELEIIESAALYDIDHVSGALARLRERGMHVALDDFGTGYSSLTYLRRLPMDTLKIDQSFIRDMLGDPEDMAIVQSIIGLARAFDCAVVGEGVETAEQALELQRLGCPLQQGYHWARPMALEAFIDWARAYGLSQAPARH